MLRDAVVANDLCGQTHALQEKMLVNTNKVQSVSDENLARGFRMLASSIKSPNHAISLNTDVEIADSFTDHILIRNVSKHH